MEELQTSLRRVECWAITHCKKLVFAPALLAQHEEPDIKHVYPNTSCTSRTAQKLISSYILLGWNTEGNTWPISTSSHLSFSLYKMGVRTIASTVFSSNKMKQAQCCTVQYVANHSSIRQQVNYTQGPKRTNRLSSSLSHSWLLRPVQKLPASSLLSCRKLCLSKLLFGARILLALLFHAHPALEAVKPHLFGACNN